MILSNFHSFLDEVANLATEAEKKRPEERTEREKIAILGKPRLGDISRAQIRIKESKEFKVSNLFPGGFYIFEFIRTPEIAIKQQLRNFLINVKHLRMR